MVVEVGAGHEAIGLEKDGLFVEGLTFEADRSGHEYVLLFLRLILDHFVNLITLLRVDVLDESGSFRMACIFEDGQRSLVFVFEMEIEGGIAEILLMAEAFVARAFLVGFGLAASAAFAFGQHLIFF